MMSVVNVRGDLDDLRVEVAFWKQAAHKALEGWAAQEDVSVAWREKLASACEIGLEAQNYPLLRREVAVLKDLLAEAEDNNA